MNLLNEKTRASLPIRDYIVITVAIVGWIVYADRRFSSLEQGKDALQKEVASLRSDRANDNVKLDKVIDTLADVRTGVARIEERTRKP
jgi:Tfp pilus assembly protein PilO